MSMVEKGMLIAIEGLDGSGKETQSNRLYERLVSTKREIKQIKYPRYDNQSSSLVKMYLSGEFGENAKEISPYIASTFYAVDRYASYKQDIEEFYNNGGFILVDRYATASMIHQGGKIDDLDEREKFLDWLADLEFNFYKIPVPDLVFFLDVPVEFSLKLIEKRDNKFTGESKKDIHERDENHLIDAYNNAIGLVEKYGWKRINCVKDGNLRTIEDIHEEIYNIVMSKLSE